MIETRMKKMFWAPTRRRHYATLRQACRAEASAIMLREWRIDGEDGHWSESEEWALHYEALAEDIERTARCRARLPDYAPDHRRAEQEADHPDLDLPQFR